MKLTSQFNDQQGYRFRGLLRILFASLWLLHSQLNCAGGWTDVSREAGACGMPAKQLSFVVWLVFILAIFSIKSVFHGFCLTLGCIASLGLLAVLLKPWGTL